MNFLLDTNVIIEAAGGNAQAKGALRQAVSSDWVGFSAITRLELFSYPELTQAEEKSLTIIIDELNEVSITRHVIDMAIYLRKMSRIKVPAIIAASAIHMQATLLTRNVSDFKQVDTLKVVNPWDA